jgi:uncharacterized protein YfaS (alpha-2-macroglobulin family)
MDQPDNGVKLSWVKSNAKWLIIISVLVLIIIIGAVYVIAQPPGKMGVKVISFKPVGEVPQTTNFTIEFSQNMVLDKTIGEQLDSVPMEFTPPITGKYRWTARHILQFYPNIMLLPSTKYKAEILPKISSEMGYYLKGKRDFEFHTQKFKVQNAQLSFKFTTPKDEIVPIIGTLEFNYPVELDSVKKHLTIAYKNGNPIPYQIVSPQAGTMIQLETEPISHGNQTHVVQLVVDSEMTPANGTSTLGENFAETFNLKPGGDLKVEGVFPERQAEFGYMKIRFSSPVNADTAKQYINVDPPIEYETTSNFHYVELKGMFVSGIAYSVSIKEGLMGVDGSILGKSFQTMAIMENREPSISFVGDGIYLARKGKLNVGLSTVNIKKARIEVRKVFINNLTHLINAGAMDSQYYWYNIEGMGKLLYTEETDIPERMNEEIITPINMESYLADQNVGIYDLQATSMDEYWRDSRKIVMITDLGITVKKAGEQFLVWINSLSSLKPIDNAKVTLISMNNQTMKVGSTNGDGLAKLEVPKSVMDEFTPFIITVSQGNDASFLELTRSQIATTDFDVDGLPYLQAGYDAYVYGDRDIYRPGEKARIVAIIRGAKASLPPSLPIKLEVLSPDNRIFAEFKKLTNDRASCEFEIDVPTYAMTGTYTARVIVGKDDEIGRGSFSVEEFMPDRMKVIVNTNAESYYLGQATNIQVSAISLFGPPASGRLVEIMSQIQSVEFAPKQWSSYSFSNPNKPLTNIVNNLVKDRLDVNGKYSFIQNLPTGISPPSSLKNMISATVHETGGRTVTAYKTVDVYPYQYFVGLRQVEEYYAEINKPKEMEFIVLNKEGQPVPNRQCDVLCYRIVYQTIMQRNNDGRVNYVSERQENLVKSFSVTSASSPVKFSFTPDQYSEYRVEVRDAVGHSSAISFYVSGWGYAPWAMSKPERLDIGLDKTIYKPGETAKVQIRSPFAGRLLLTVDGDKVYSFKSENMEKNTATINVKISDEYKPNVYISASVIRSTQSLEQNAPVRAYGIVPLMVDSSKNKISIALDAPAEMRPNNKLKVSFTVNGRKKDGYITIAAVDEGICQLTNFQPPDPFAHFFGKKRLEVSSHDIYAWILPEIEGAKSTSSASGGEPGAIKRRVSPISVARVKPVALWSGLVKVNKNGKGSVTFDVPQFNGSLRIMAVSFSEDEFGSARKDVIIRDPIVLTPTIPRFMASGDRFVVPVSVFNGTDKTDSFTVTLNASGPVETPSPTTHKITISPKQESQVLFNVKAKNLMGKVTFKVSASGAGEKVSEETDVPLRPASPPVTLTGSGTVKAGTSGTFIIPGNWIPNSTDFEVTVSSLPAMQFASSLQYLLSYPYGCAEQTTSKVFPLLYFNDMAKAIEPKLFGSQSAEYFVNEGITKLVNMQFPSGDFSFWPSASYGNPWTSIYVSHFLAEARKAGYEVPERAYKNMVKALQGHAKSPITDDWQLEIKAYACYVLAIVGEPDRSTMLYLKNTELDKMSDYSQSLLAGAFAFSGDVNTANSMIPTTVQSREEKRDTGRNFYSPIRADAIMLSVLAEINPDHPSVPKLVERLANSASKINRWYTTQENAFAFLALGKLFKKQPPGKYTGSISVNGSNIGNFTSKDQHFTGKDWGGKEIKLNIQGTGTCYYYWKAFGIPLENEVKEFDQELTVRRKYLTGDGKPVDYMNFQQGDLVVAEITCKALTEDLDNVVIADLLPAGFEIENPRLGSRAGVTWIKDTGINSDYMDIRDDRMLLFARLPKLKEVKFYYAIRVVTIGDFVLPAISAEAMYDPAKASVSSGGRIRVAQ